MVPRIIASSSLLALVIVATSANAARGSPSLQGLAVVPGGPTNTSAWYVSADGLVTVPSTSIEAFRWTTEEWGQGSSDGTTLLADLNGGAGVRTQEGADIRILAKNGVSIDLDLGGEETLNGVISEIQSSAIEVGVSAELVPLGNAIRLLDSTGGLGVFGTQRLRLSPALDDIGLNVGARTKLDGTPLNWGFDLSSDLRRVVGYTYIGDDRAGFMWDPIDGLQLLQDVLSREYGINLAGWRLTEVRGISDDGLVLAGLGINPSGVAEGWIVKVPEPSYAPILLLYLLRPGRVARPRSRKACIQVSHSDNS